MKFFIVGLFICLFNASPLAFAQEKDPELAEPIFQETENSPFKERIKPRNLFVTGGYAFLPHEHQQGAFIQLTSRVTSSVRLYAEAISFLPFTYNWGRGEITIRQKRFGFGAQYSVLCHEKYVVYAMGGLAYLSNLQDVYSRKSPFDTIMFEPVVTTKTIDESHIDWTLGLGGQWNIGHRWAVKMEARIGYDLLANTGITYFLIP